MAIRLNPDHSDPESDLETQLFAMGAIIAGNLLSVALLQNKLERRRHPEASVPPIFDLLPKISIGLFLGTSLYFLALSRRDVRENPNQTALWLVFAANLLSTASVGLKTHVVFSSPPESTATVGSVEP